MTYLKTCHECGASFTARRHDACFCSTPCRKTFHNRRAVRGAEMYDLFRALRRERSKASSLNLWTELCRLELRWFEEDDGRRTYLPPEEALLALRESGRLMMGEPLQRIRAGR